MGASYDIYDFDEAQGENLKYDNIELFELPELPANISFIPAWLSKQIVFFDADVSFQHVTLNDFEFVFGPQQARVVELLYQAWLTENPWRKGLGLLKAAGSKQPKLGDLFKKTPNWRELIKGDDRGKYRINFDHQGKNKS